MKDKPTIDVAAAREFLSQHAPFSRIADEAMAAFVPKLQLVRFPRGAQVLSAASGPVAHLHIVVEGAVSSRPSNPQAESDRTIGPGELFPIGVLSAGGTTTRMFSALQDTSCYLAARDDFLALRQASPEFERYCTQVITETLKLSLESLSGQYSQRVAEQQTLTRPLSELVRLPPVACSATVTLREAAQKMDGNNVRTIITLGDDGRPIGMFTLLDLLRRVVLPGLSLETPVSEAMTTPLLTLPPTATAYEALHLMAARGVRQVAVVEADRLVGVVNERDLFALQRVSMRQVHEGVATAGSVEELTRAGADIRALTGNLLAQGVNAEALTRTIAALNDSLTRRLLDLVAARHDLAGIDWCWLALGSEGRGEQTFATDQDNAMLFAAADEADTEAKRARLLAFATEVNDGLAQLGFPLCEGKVMAGNPEYCLSVAEWQQKFLAWIREPTPQALLGANIVFDFRGMHGNLALAWVLQAWLLRYTGANPMFLRLMVQNALEVEPPLGLIRTFVVDDDAEPKGAIDLKTRGTRLFVDCARVLGLAHGVADSNTVARLRQAGAQLKLPEQSVDATIDAFQFLQLLRLRQQESQAGGGSNRIDPYKLNAVDQRMLKEAFRQAKQLQDRLRLAYRL